ncbi:type II toxin-antitoxin system ParD family antitoxin [Devosia sp. YIM 151766]|uniref:type II toxin-antitoxin system ParD family antitoxin n=1 Tax=Devosia sp. YIM 151766 TaxID=3017325 RepID=UPI00255C5CDC|nr:type II toxin-antitoxin system ParD family antitoxin [Devosia sp. YIM 151766]WIY51859.1 type II toxin-antitoxin system ParD family antitoxin [Devosia sp. YIM 151766]
MKTLTISVTEQQATLLEAAVAEGKYASDSEVVREALKLWERREAARLQEWARLRAEVEAGLASGPGEPFDFDDFLAKAHARHISRG